MSPSPNTATVRPTAISVTFTPTRAMLARQATVASMGSRSRGQG